MTAAMNNEGCYLRGYDLKASANKEPMGFRLFLPASLRCNTCLAYFSRDTMFNSCREAAHGEEYLGRQIWRFHFNCTNCSAELSVKTDPKNSLYVVECGARRDYEPEEEEEEEQDTTAKDEDMAIDAMSSSENRTHRSKRVADVLARFEEMRSLQDKKLQEEADEATISLIKSLRSERRVRRVEDDGGETGLAHILPRRAGFRNTSLPILPLPSRISLSLTKGRKVLEGFPSGPADCPAAAIFTDKSSSKVEGNVIAPLDEMQPSKPPPSGSVDEMLAASLPRPKACLEGKHIRAKSPTHHAR